MAWAALDDSALAVAVADGHGSASCFRSGKGAALAVAAAVTVLQDFAARYPDYQAAAVAAAEIPQQLVELWRQMVADDLEASPVLDSERPPNNGRLGSELRAYGSTLLAVLGTLSHVLYLQLGDGDILVVSEDGTVTRPWLRDPRLLGVETTSLCGPDAAGDTRVAVEPHAGASPAMLLLATDGYANSFRDDDGFLRTGCDLLDMVRTSGVDTVERNLESWLNEASEFGSGDDITLAVLCRTALEGSHGD